MDKLFGVILLRLKEKYSLITIKKLKKILLFIISISYATPAFSQVAFYYHGIENGLPEARIVSISQDSTGFIWLAGENALFRYDGNQFLSYRSSNRNSLSIPFIKINTLFTDVQGTLWVDANNGFAYYDFLRDEFIKPVDGWDLTRITDFCQGSKETLWISTDEGLAEFDIKTKNIVWFTGKDTLKTPGNNILKNGDLKFITCQSDGKIWMATNPTGLFRLDPETKKLEDFGVIDSINYGKFIITKLLFYKEQLYISTLNNGFFWFNPKDKKVHNEVFGDLGYTVHHFQISNDSVAWLATNNGLFHYNFQTSGYQRFTNEPFNPLSMARSAINHVFVDKENNLWISSGIRGINFGLTNVPFLHFTVSEDEAYQLSHKEITAIQFDYKGNMWLGYELGMVEKHSHTPLAKKQFNLTSKSRSGTTGAIMRIFEDSKNRIWIGGWASGVQKLNASGTAFEFAPIQPASTATLIESADVRGITEDNEGNIWFSFHGIGIGRYNPETHFLKLYRFDPENPLTNLSNDYSFNLCTDKENNIWIASAHGVSKLNCKNEKFTNFYAEAGNPNSLSSSSVNVIFCDPAGVIWAGTSNGLNAFIPKLNNFQSILTDQDFPFLKISAIQSVEPGELWASTQTGILGLTYKWNSNNDSLLVKYKFFDRSNGILSTNYFALSSASDKENRIFFGGNEGIDFFDPGKIRLTNQKLIKPMIIGLNVGGLSKFHQIKTDNPGIPYIELKNTARMINIRFTSFQFNNPGGQKFRYRLEGFDDSWIYPMNDQLASFSNLPPGEYVFKLQIQKNNGDWNGQESELAIKIKPPFWMTLPFIGVTILFFILALFIILKVRSRSMLLRQYELEQIIDKRTEELTIKNQELEKSNQTKNKFFSIVFHDLKSPFSGLLGILELLNDPENKLEEKTQKQMLKSAKDSANNTFELMENLLVWARSQMNKSDCHPQINNLSELLRKNIELKQVDAEQKEIKVITEIPEKLEAYFDLNMIDTVIRNILSNAIKFSEPGGKIIVLAETQKEEIIVKIADTGIGLKEEETAILFEIDKKLKRGTGGEKGTGLGLIICKEFIEKNGGRIWVTPNMPIGTVFNFTIPEKKQPEKH